MSGAVSSPIPSNWRVPLFYARFDPSNANAGQVNQRTLLIGQVAPGVSVPATPQPVLSPTQARGTYGAQSFLARMVADYMANDPTATLYALALPAAGGATAAACTLTFSGTTTAASVLSLYIAGDLLSIGLASGLAATAVATAVAAAVQANGVCCMSAAAAGAVVTLTSETLGAVSNQIDVRLNYGGLPAGEATPAGLTVTVGAVSGGATDPDMSAIDATLGDGNWDFIVTPYTLSGQTAALSAALNNVAGRWSVTRQSYGHVFAARSDSYANLLSLGGGLNDPHLTLFGSAKSPTPPWRAAAIFAGAAAASLKNLASQPLQTLPLVGFLPPADSDRFSKANINALLNAGIAVGDYTNAGTAQIVRAVTTYQFNSYGLPDQSYLDTETLFTLMAITRRVAAMFTSKYPRALLVPDGTHVGPGLPVISPTIALAEIFALYDTFEEDGLADNPTAMQAATSARISSTDPSRLEIFWTPNLVSGCRIIDMVNRFTLLAPVE